MPLASGIKTVTYTSAETAFGKKKGKSVDWFDAYFTRLKPLIESQRSALQEYKRSPSPVTLEALRNARSRVEQEARICANELWMDLCTKIQADAA